jgi:hypothetical protein
MTVTAGATQTWVTLNGDGNGIGMPNLDASGNPTTAAAMPNGYKVTGVSTSAMPTTFPSGGTMVGAVPYVGFQVNINATN